MIKILTFFTGLVFGATAGFAQQTPIQEGKEIVVGRSYTIASKFLGEDREIMVALPEGYEQGDENYPVIYLLEGHWFFTYAANLAERITPHGFIQPSIIVATKMANPTRFNWLNPGLEKSDQYMDFLEKELMPFVADNFRSDDRRILMGWEYGGAFTLKVLSQRPELFDGYIASSPFPINEHNTNFEALNDLATTAPGTEKYLYFGVSENERVVNEGVARLKDQLNEKTPKALLWQTRTFTGGDLVTTHITSAYPVFRAGLSGYYADYRPLRPENAEKFHAMGGVDFAKEYYAKRAQKYGLSPEIDPQAVWWLMRIAMEGDDLVLMEELMVAVDVFTDSLSPYWYAQFSNFLYEKGRQNIGLKMLKKAVKLYPDSLTAVANLAKLYVKEGAKSDAVAAYKRAIKIAEKEEHPRVNDLREMLNAIEE